MLGKKKRKKKGDTTLHSVSAYFVEEGDGQKTRE